MVQHPVPSSRPRDVGRKNFRRPAATALSTVFTRAYANTPYFPLYTTPPESYVLSVLIRVSLTLRRAEGVQ